VTDVRLLVPADIDAYDAVHLAGLEEFPAAFTTDADAWRSAPRQTIMRHLERSETDPGRPILGAWEGGKLIGLIGINREERRSVSHKAGLWGFYVVTEHRRRGVGRQLLTAATANAAEMSGLHQLRAVVATSCTAAVALFEHMRFERFGYEPDGRLVDGRFHDLAYFRYVPSEPQRDS
jgi:RimJ/RimL family protein N-acetyltransferase